jgi:hypothetical protein
MVGDQLVESRGAAGMCGLFGMVGGGGSPRGCSAGELLGHDFADVSVVHHPPDMRGGPRHAGRPEPARLGSRVAGYRCKVIACPKEGTVLITILVILLIIAVALFIWRNMAGRRV